MEWNGVRPLRLDRLVWAQESDSVATSGVLPHSNGTGTKAAVVVAGQQQRDSGPAKKEVAAGGDGADLAQAVGRGGIPASNDLHLSGANAGAPPSI